MFCSAQVRVSTHRQLWSKASMQGKHIFPQSLWCILSQQFVSILKHLWEQLLIGHLTPVQQSVHLFLCVRDVISSSELCDKWLLMHTSTEALMEGCWPKSLRAPTGKTACLHRSAVCCVKFYSSVFSFFSPHKFRMLKEKWEKTERISLMINSLHMSRKTNTSLEWIVTYLHMRATPTLLFLQKQKCLPG